MAHPQLKLARQVRVAGQETNAAASAAPHILRDGRAARYALLRELGHGSMGTVWLAYDGVRQQHVALKRVLIPSATGIFRLKREFRAIAPLRHRNLVPLYELWSDSRGPFFTMEFIEGRDLRRLLLEELAYLAIPDRIRFARHMTTEVLFALGFLHAHGVIHRDLKPSNVMAGADGILKLVDFGIVAHRDEHVAIDRRGAGTPPYTAPEQGHGEPPTPESDMYSLGVLLLDVISGTPASARENRGRDDTRPLRAHFERFRPAMPDDLASLCDSLLQDDRRRRPDAQTALAKLGDASRTCVVPEHGGPAASPIRDRLDERLDQWLAARMEAVSVGAFDVAIVEAMATSRENQLLAWSRDFARKSGGLVLAGGSRPQEHVEYNVLDAAVDALASVVFDTLADAELGRDLALASNLFPVLAGRRPPTSAVSRSRAFDALIRILASFAGAGGVYLVIEDLHRADAKSLAFLERLIERRPAGVALVANASAGAQPTPIGAWLESQRRIGRVPVSPSIHVWALRPEASSRSEERVFAGGAALTGRVVLSPRPGRKFG